MDLILLIFGFSVLGLIAALYFARYALKATGDAPAKMVEIAAAIREGAEAFLRRQNRTILKLSIPVAFLIFVLYAYVRESNAADPGSPMVLAIWTTVSFVLGAACSVVAGYVGMFVSIRANLRTANAARTSLNDAMRIALRGGAVSGLFVVAMSLIGVGGLYYLATILTEINPTKIPLLIAGYGFGASFVALFAQLGGGIYTKAADVGADLVGKVEAGIPEDDPRNPAVIADLVGDNVGDCAGRGADLFESTAAENIGAMILGSTLALNATSDSGTKIFATSAAVIGVMLFPLVARAFGILASIIGVLVVRCREDEDPMKALNRGYYLTSFLSAIGFFVATKWLLSSEQAPNAWWMFFLCGVIGIATAQAFVYITQYYTEYRYRPVKEIANASVTGPATNIISGISVGMECTMAPVIVISAAILISYYFGEAAIVGGGLFGTAVATMGMLGTAGYILAMDTFGPITDNAGGIVEMSQQPEEIRKKTDRLDAVGNTTKALTKGYAIGSAALAAFLLFSAYIDEVHHYNPTALQSVNIAKPAVFVGALLGAMLVFLFSSLAIKAVSRAASAVIQSVREEFRAKPGILKGTEKPDYGKCVDIVTQGALKAMVLPGVLVVAMPIVVGLVFKYWLGLGAEVVAAFLMVGTITGILVALFLNTAGGAWDNAKKYIETGEFTVDGKSVGKRSEPHKAAVVGDTVGDPFKDTAGPSLHVLVKLISTVTLVCAPFFV